MNDKTAPNLKDELMKDHELEAGDHDKYLKLADHADEEYPDRGYGSILRDIAKEEEIHRKHIGAILDDISKLEGEHNG